MAQELSKISRASREQVLVDAKQRVKDNATREALLGKTFCSVVISGEEINQKDEFFSWLRSEGFAFRESELHEGRISVGVSWK